VEMAGNLRPVELDGHGSHVPVSMPGNLRPVEELDGHGSRMPVEQTTVGARPVERTEYNPDLVANDNGYGQIKDYCYMKESTEFVDKCEPYTEETCVTQNIEDCREVEHRNCTGTVETKVDRVCFNVEELICSLKENVNYDTVEEEYLVQMCTMVKDRICDTTYDMDIISIDDFQCCNLDSVFCEDSKEIVINDVVCKHTFDFDCSEEKKTDGSYGKETVCRKVHKDPCYETPRTVRKELCRQETNQYCHKFTNPVPQPVQKQNCHFVAKKLCEVDTRTRYKKAKRYSYTPHCHPVPREICDQTEVNTVAPVCSTEKRFDCDYIPRKKCMQEQKQYCWKVEQKVQKEVCDKKFSYEYV